MTNKQFRPLWNDALISNDRDAFVSDWALSSIWEDEPTAEIPPARIEQIGSIWDAAHRSVREIASASGLSQRKLAEQFCIPFRTMEDWCGGSHAAPHYVRLMMQLCLGLISPCYSITIPNCVTKIENNSFNDCCSISNISIPDSVTRVEDYAFSVCQKI